MNGVPSEPTGSYALAKMAKGKSAAYTAYGTVEEAIAAGREIIAAATRLEVHIKTPVIVSDARQLIMWAAASDGWETDHGPGSSPELR